MRLFSALSGQFTVYTLANNPFTFEPAAFAASLGDVSGAPIMCGQTFLDSTAYGRLWGTDIVDSLKNGQRTAWFENWMDVFLANISHRPLGFFFDEESVLGTSFYFSDDPHGPGTLVDVLRANQDFFPSFVRTTSGADLATYAGTKANQWNNWRSVEENRVLNKFIKKIKIKWPGLPTGNYNRSEFLSDGLAVDPSGWNHANVPVDWSQPVAYCIRGIFANNGVKDWKWNAFVQVANTVIQTAKKSPRQWPWLPSPRWSETYLGSQCLTAAEALVWNQYMLELLSALGTEYAFVFNNGRTGDDDARLAAAAAALSTSRITHAQLAAMSVINRDASSIIAGPFSLSYTNFMTAIS